MNLRNVKCGSSRRGKRPKEPRRGLGVAQLEKLRLHEQMAGGHVFYLHGSTHNEEEVSLKMMHPVTASSATASPSTSSALPHNFMMRSGQMERLNSEYQAGAVSRSFFSNEHNFLRERHYFQHSKKTQASPLFRQPDEEKEMWRECAAWMNPSKRNCDSNDTEELDLELKL